MAVQNISKIPGEDFVLSLNLERISDVFVCLFFKNSLCSISNP